MMFPRSKLISQFHDVFLKNERQYISITGEKHVGKHSFIELLRLSTLFQDKEILTFNYQDNGEFSESILNENRPNVLIIENCSTEQFSLIKTIISQYLPESRIIITSNETIEDEDVEIFPLGGISFREYIEAYEKSIDISSIMRQDEDIEPYNTLLSQYVKGGQYPENLIDNSNIEVYFFEKISMMYQELFEKERGIFMEFITTVAMNVGDIFKEERIAKSLNISRRKVRKYTEILIKYNMICAVGPWISNQETETSRHVKIYFTDLSYFFRALGMSYYLGENRQGVLENFILLELVRKLGRTHEIRFYRKKSQAEVSFILTDRKTQKITPIDIVAKSTTTIPIALKIFCETYNTEIEHAMLMNTNLSGQKVIQNIHTTILPHIAI